MASTDDGNSWHSVRKHHLNDHFITQGQVPMEEKATDERVHFNEDSEV